MPLYAVLSLGALSAINFLFAVKYIARVTPHSLPVSVVYCVFVRRRRIGPASAAGLAVIMAGAFAATLVPLYLWHPAAFREYNPLTVQNALLPGWLKVTLLVAAVAAGWRALSFETLVRYCGWVIFGVITASFIQLTLQTSWTHAVYESGFDISYLLLSLPYLMLSLTDPESTVPGREQPRDVHPGPEGGGDTQART